MDPFTAISMGISVVGGVTKMIDGFAKKKAAEERMRKLEAAPLPLNAFEALQLPQEGIKDRRESLERQKMDTVARLQQGGTRALAANLGKVNEQGIQAERQIGIDTDDAMFRKNQMQKLCWKILMLTLKGSNQPLNLLLLNAEMTFWYW